MDLLIMQFSATSYHFIPLELNILLSSLISNTETHYIFLNAEDQVYCRYDALEIAKRTRQFALWFSEYSAQNYEHENI